MYFRAERNDRPFGDGKISVPENYSGSAFNGGLVAPEDAEKILEREEVELPAPQQNEPEEHNEEKIPCAIPSHINAKREGRKTVGESLATLADSFLGSEELLIIGLIFLIYNGNLDEDIITLLIVLLL